MSFDFFTAFHFKMSSSETQGQLVGMRESQNIGQRKVGEKEKSLLSLLLFFADFLPTASSFPVTPTNCPWVSEDV